MTRIEAHALLDALRSGVHAPTRRINEALAATGDLTNYRPSEPAPVEAARQWPYYHHARETT